MYAILAWSSSTSHKESGQSCLNDSLGGSYLLLVFTLLRLLQVILD